MIFKNQEPQIKHIAADVRRDEVDPNAPFDYRTELRESDKRRILDELDRRSREQPQDYEMHPEFDYLQLLAAVRNLNVEIPELDRHLLHAHEISSRRFREEPSKAIRGPIWILPMALIDYKMLTSLSAESFLKMKNSLLASADISRSDVQSQVAARLLEPSKEHELLEAWVKDRLRDLVRDPEHIRSHLKSLLIAKIISRRFGSLIKQIQPETWRAIRQKIQQSTNTLEFAELVMLTRCLVADDIIVDAKGVHIVDPELPPATPAEVPKPVHKRI